MPPLIRTLARTSAHPSVVLVRLLVAGDLVLDGARAARWHWLIGESRLDRLVPTLTEGAVIAAGYLEIGCGLLVAAGLMTRAACLLPLALPALMAIEAYPRIHSLKAASMLDATVHHGGVALAALYLLIVGGGRASLDHQIISAPLFGSGPRVRRRR